MRETGHYRITKHDGEEVRAFVPFPLPPRDPPLVLDEAAERLLREAEQAVDRLGVAGAVVPSVDWFVYGFVRREALESARIEGTQATLRDVVTFEATQEADNPDDVEEVANVVEALGYARREMRSPDGLPLSTRLLCETHRRLMRGVRGQERSPGEIRRSQNWIGGSRPGNARFVPPPAESVVECLSDLQRWLHGADPLPALVRAGLAHVQFETIHPFLDGNGRLGRLLITLLLEHWGVMQRPLLSLSVALKRRQREYYARLSAVPTEGDWEGWTWFFLECARDAADEGVAVAQTVADLLSRDRERLLGDHRVSVGAVRLFEMLPSRPVVTVAMVTELLETTKPTAGKAVDALVRAGILTETTGRQRDRAYAYQRYLTALSPE